MVHCNLHLGAIFVSEKTWLWKVAGMEAACAVDKLDAKVPVHTCACVVCYTHMWVVIYMAFLLGVSVIMSQNFNWVYCTSCYVSVYSVEHLV